MAPWAAGFFEELGCHGQKTEILLLCSFLSIILALKVAGKEVTSEDKPPMPLIGLGTWDLMVRVGGHLPVFTAGF